MFKKLVLAAALAAAAPAMAAIGTQASGNGEVFVVASNFGAASEASRVTYVYDTGLALNSFQPGVGPFSMAMTGWSSFLSTLSTAGGSLADVRFSVLALGATNANPSVNPGTLRLLTTSTLPAADTISAGDDSDLQNQDLSATLSQSSKVSQFLNATNLRGTHASTTNGFSVSTRSGATDQGDYSNAFLDSLGFQGGELTFTTSAAVGETIGALYARNSAPGTGYGARAANVIDYAESTFSVLNDGTLVYSVAAIPEPGEIAFMLSGLALASLVARRRAARRS